jgi:hypothetical protein
MRGGKERERKCPFCTRWTVGECRQSFLKEVMPRPRLVLWPVEETEALEPRCKRHTRNPCYIPTSVNKSERGLMRGIYKALRSPISFSILLSFDCTAPG